MEAEEIGHGGMLMVSKASNFSRKSITKREKELHDFKNNDSIEISDAIEKVVE